MTIQHILYIVTLHTHATLIVDRYVGIMILILNGKMFGKKLTDSVSRDSVTSVEGAGWCYEIEVKQFSFFPVQSTHSFATWAERVFDNRAQWGLNSLDWNLTIMILTTLF